MVHLYLKNHLDANLESLSQATEGMEQQGLDQMSVIQILATHLIAVLFRGNRILRVQSRSVSTNKMIKGLALSRKILPQITIEMKRIYCSKRTVSQIRDSKRLIKLSAFKQYRATHINGLILTCGRSDTNSTPKCSQLNSKNPFSA